MDSDETAALPTIADAEMQLSAELSNLATEAKADILREMRHLRDPDCPPAHLTALVVMNGTSPLASLAPPELRKGGARMYVARLMMREPIRRAFALHSADVAGRLGLPPSCDPRHLQALVSTAAGGSLVCCVCDLGMDPDAALS